MTDFFGRLKKRNGTSRFFFLLITVQLEDGHESFRGHLYRAEVAHLFLARWKSFAFQRRFARQFE